MNPAFLSGLNEPQLEAVTLPAVPLAGQVSPQSALILAGAGSGKTRVLTTRIAWLIQTGQARPQGLLGVTFTNKAAKEMLLRISAMLPINTRGMWVGTFHGLCNRILRSHYRDAGLPQTFQILDSADQLALLKRVMKGMNLDDEKYPPRQGPAAPRLPGAWNDVSRPLSPAKITIVLSRSPNASSLSSKTWKSPSTIWMQSATAPPLDESWYSALGSTGK